jgi:hypothetical protein
MRNARLAAQTLSSLLLLFICVSPVRGSMVYSPHSGAWNVESGSGNEVERGGDDGVALPRTAMHLPPHLHHVSDDSTQ